MLFSAKMRVYFLAEIDKIFITHIPNSLSEKNFTFTFLVYNFYEIIIKISFSSNKSAL